ncbi:GAF and ANTAR domain-containing protein [Kribbella sp. NPDC003557]|uniref:GAF and ANTAR domain-containing protein n=1 Tax=Kribbella sp. NPDC003557 TaxID=3154449 RepID=UPI00339F54CA
MDDVRYQACDTVSDLVARLVTDEDLSGTLAWLTEECARLPGVTASALLLVDRQGTLSVAAASSAPVRRLQEAELRVAEGPAHDSYDRGARVDCLDAFDADRRWPRFAPVARRRGVQAVHAFPLPSPARTIGVLTMFMSEPGGLSDVALVAGQVLASTVALGIESHQAAQLEIRTDQLQTALDSRVLIEQAKGLLSERLGLSLDDAFTVMRRHARNNGERLVGVAAAVLDGTLTLPAHSPR